MEKKTPLYERHTQHGGKMAPFAGYLLPMQYSGLIAEHMAVRKAAGLFDVSHMTEIFVEGPGALEYVNLVFTNDFTKMEPGKVRYSLMLNKLGGIVDDMVIYKESDECFVVVGNGANREKDFEHMASHSVEGAIVTDKSDSYAQMAIQGPNSKAILELLVDKEHIPEKYYSFKHGKIMGKDAVISRTGYTGELGYELYVNPGDACIIWDGILKAGEGAGLVPCGLGARDTLRLEAAMPLYGHEMTDTINPIEAGLGFAVKMGKESFTGKAALLENQNTGRVRVGIKVTGKGIVRENCPIFAAGEKIGITTSGTHAPYLGYSIAMGYVKEAFKAPGTKLEIQVRGRMIESEITEMPFYSK